MKSTKSKIFSVLFLLCCALVWAQYTPHNLSNSEKSKARKWVNKTYRGLSEDEKLGQLFIVALYTNKGEEAIQKVIQAVNEEKIGGLILMQDDAARHMALVNGFQRTAKVPLLIGMDAEWGLYQRIPTAYKFPWALTLGAIQDKNLIAEMSAKIAEDAQRMGVNWDFAPVVDVNTNPLNPIIGNRSFGSEVTNVVRSAEAYASGLQDNKILAAIKHFPGHGDTALDSHLELPEVSHDRVRLDSVELAPFRSLMNKGIGGVMVAHLYVPALEPQPGIPASLSYNIITKLLKEKYGYQGLIITDALNMGAVAKRFQPGEVDALAFKAGNDIMLFSDGVKEGKRLIRAALHSGEIPRKRLEESVKKILLTKFYLGLTEVKPKNPQNINTELNTPAHHALGEKLYSNALTLIKDEKKLLPLNCKETLYYLPLEEAPYSTFAESLNVNTTVVTVKPEDLAALPQGAKVLVGLHKDNSSAYKPYIISAESKMILQKLAANHAVLLTVFGSPYALRDIDITPFSTVLVAYENNEDSQRAVAKSLVGENRIHGRLPVMVNAQLPAGFGIDLPAKKMRLQQKKTAVN